MTPETIDFCIMVAVTAFALIVTGLGISLIFNDRFINKIIDRLFSEDDGGDCST